MKQLDGVAAFTTNAVGSNSHERLTTITGVCYPVASCGFDHQPPNPNIPTSSEVYGNGKTDFCYSSSASIAECTAAMKDVFYTAQSIFQAAGFTQWCGLTGNRMRSSPTYLCITDTILVAQMKVSTFLFNPYMWGPNASSRSLEVRPPLLLAPLARAAASCSLAALICDRCARPERSPAPTSSTPCGAPSRRANKASHNPMPFIAASGVCCTRRSTPP